MKKLGLCLLAVATLSAGAFAACSTNDGTPTAGNDAGGVGDGGGDDDSVLDGSVPSKDGSVTDAGSPTKDGSATDASDDGGCGALCETGPRDASARCFDDGGPQNPVAIPANAIWASAVDSFSSEYNPESDSWNAIQVLGAPDVYPAYGDIGGAWATQVQDLAGESIAVTFPADTKGRAIWIFETYNPDAISKVTVSTAGGDIVVYTNAAPTSINDALACSHVLAVPTSTTAAILKVKVELASDLVPSWNEIDAIGVIP